MLDTQSKIVDKFNLNFYSVFPDKSPQFLLRST